MVTSHPEKTRTDIGILALSMQMEVRAFMSIEGMLGNYKYGNVMGVAKAEKELLTLKWHWRGQPTKAVISLRYANH